MKTLIIAVVLTTFFILTTPPAQGATLTPAFCPPGALLNKVTDTCDKYEIAPPQCPMMYAYNPSTNLCIKLPPNGEETTAPICQGGEFIPSTDSCFKSIRSSPSCPVSTTYSSSLDGCV